MSLNPLRLTEGIGIDIDFAFRHDNLLLSNCCLAHVILSAAKNLSKALVAIACLRLFAALRMTPQGAVFVASLLPRDSSPDTCREFVALLIGYAGREVKGIALPYHVRITHAIFIRPTIEAIRRR